MLPEAVAPLLEQLAGAHDVASPLARRFNMQRWFAAQGLAPPPVRPRAAAMHRNASVPQLALLSQPSAELAPATPATEPTNIEVLRQSPATATLLVCDFDRWGGPDPWWWMQVMWRRCGHWGLVGWGPAWLAVTGSSALHDAAGSIYCHIATPSSPIHPTVPPQPTPTAEPWWSGTRASGCVMSWHPSSPPCCPPFRCLPTSFQSLTRCVHPEARCCLLSPLLVQQGGGGWAAAAAQMPPRHRSINPLTLLHPTILCRC